jgi:hypothetical protein
MAAPATATMPFFLQRRENNLGRWEDNQSRLWWGLRKERGISDVGYTRWNIMRRCILAAKSRLEGNFVSCLGGFGRKGWKRYNSTIPMQFRLSNNK